MALLSLATARFGRLLLLGAALCGSVLPCLASGTSEYRLKAVFLFNFARFTQWPAQAFSSPTAPFVIGVLGEDPFASDLDELVRGEKVDGHLLTVRRFQQVEEIRECHILFVSPGKARQLTQILSKLQGRSVLTVGETAEFPQRGGMIGFVTGTTIKVRINVEAARAANLVISSKLLRAAEIVPQGKG